jgi:uncharacterized YccA/Bax inhibitor family protein
MNKTVLYYASYRLCYGDMVDAFNGSLVPAIGGAIAGLAIVVIAAFKPQYSLFSSGYALFEGLFIGGVSAILKLNILVL